jgi:hypothetical protein
MCASVKCSRSDRTFCDFSDPPSKLSVTGYEEGTTIVAGTVLKLTCTATAGNPLATLTWYKNDRKVGEIAGRAIVGTRGSFSENWDSFLKVARIIRDNGAKSFRDFLD